MRRAAVLLTLMALTVAAPASAAVKLPLSHAGRWITDASGRVAVLHGLNMVYKRPPYAPDAIGFGDDDAAFLASEGYNTVRVGLIYKAVEPSPGVYDDAYLARIEGTVDALARHGIVSLLDFHQDMYNERFQGEGWPDWAVQDDGLPNQPQNGFPGNYLAMPALQHAFDHFWANDPGPGGVGLQDRYAAAWRHVAERFSGNPSVLGYDLLNEPWPGSTWQQCANPAGCPEFDGRMSLFVERVLGAIRAADPQSLVWYEPNSLFNNGADTQLADFRDKHAGMSFHDYCLASNEGGSSYSQACQASDDLVMSNADKRAAATGDALLMSEWGATDDRASLLGPLALADKHMMSWQEWHYCGCNDPTTTGSGDKQAIVLDPAKPPTGSNLKTSTLDVITRPYPQLVSGTPTSWSFDPDSKKFAFSYSTARAGDASKRFGAGAVSAVVVPKRQYPKGYAADVRGGAIVSKPGALLLRVAACAGAKDVNVSVVAGGGPSQSSCAKPGKKRPRLTVTLSPRRVRAGRRVKVVVWVRAGKAAVRGAVVRLGRKRSVTGRRGRAVLRVRFAKPGRHRAVARARGYRSGKATLRVVR
ncbi:MAG: endoglycosylceramidase [Thermoleophilaceae bacterium]|nr:endoglycosylceramidase [Thermoleophilaceae bacterium]